ncbi:MAG: hypothetical protein A2Y33_09985 [Spirochaetes bacterium GWF1_51_8]|nr:MAG: hypothetical protein A2Y33_09985 [Spirochaetes bacterium GWF1_51_8]
MKYLIVILMIIAGTVKCAKSPDIRNVEWGMTAQEVADLETAELAAKNVIDYGGSNTTNYNENVDYLTFEGVEFGVETYIEYRIGITGLSEVRYRFPSTANANDQAFLVERIRAYYSETLGEPEVVEGGAIYHWKSKKGDVTLSYFTKPLLQFTPHIDKSFAQMLKDAQKAMNK